MPSLARKFEAEQKKIAQQKREEALTEAVENGAVVDTVLHSLIRPEHVLYAGRKLAGSIESRLTSGKNAQKLSENTKCLLRLLTTHEKRDLNSFPYSNRFAQLALDAVLTIAFSQTGEVFDGGDGYVFESQQFQKVVDLTAASVLEELQILSLMPQQKHTEDSEIQAKHRAAYYSLIRILNQPAIPASGKAVAKAAAIRGADPAAELEKSWKSARKYEYPEPTSDSPYVTLDADSLSIYTIAGVLLDIVSDVPEEKKAEWSFWKIVPVCVSEKKTLNFLTLNPPSGKDRTDLIREASKLAKYRGPVEQVNEWSDGFFGGYLENEFTHSDTFVRGATRTEQPSVPSQMVYDAVNAVQSVRWVVNSFILDAVQELLPQLTKDTAKLGKFIAPVKGVHFTKTQRVTAALIAAQEWVGKEFVVPWNVDYRGRMYPIASVLTIQSTEFEKSLLKFAETRPITDATHDWLSIHLSAVFGNGCEKQSLADRKLFASQYAEIISAIAENPVGYLLECFEGSQEFIPEKPFQFVAACEEYYAIFIAKTRDYTNLPVAADCTCSGIQILSGLLKDEEAARMVNVVPSGELQDAYGAVAEKVNDVLRAHPLFSEYSDLIDRSVVKKSVMTLAYNASALSMREYTYMALQKKKELLPPADQMIPGSEKSYRTEFYSVVVAAIQNAMGTLMPHIMATQKWMQKAQEANMSGLAGVHYFEFSTPSQFMMKQKKQVPLLVRQRNAFSGKNQECTIQYGEKPVVDSGAHATCTMPNVVHALDASLLHSSFCSFLDGVEDEVRPFALIHDSVMTAATDMPAALDGYRQAYVKHFSDGGSFEQLVSKLDADQKDQILDSLRGSLDVNVARESEYMLS